MNRVRLLVLVLLAAFEFVTSTHAEATVVNMQNYEGVFTKVDINSISEDGQEKMVSYYVSNFKTTWQEASETCVNLIKKKFVSIPNATANTDIMAAMYAANVNPAWTSGRFSPTTSSFTWTASGQSFTYTEWMSGNRNYNFQSYPCVALYNSASGWHALSCTNLTYFICE